MDRTYTSKKIYTIYNIWGKQFKIEEILLFLAVIILFLLNHRGYFNSNEIILWYYLHKDAT